MGELSEDSWGRPTLNALGWVRLCSLRGHLLRRDDAGGEATNLGDNVALPKCKDLTRASGADDKLCWGGIHQVDSILAVGLKACWPAWKITFRRAGQLPGRVHRSQGGGFPPDGPPERDIR